jgi:NTE family protein
MKLGIALGGGGAKGFAHLGVLKALQRHGIEFDVVTGTSIGSLVGAAYSAGYIDDLEAAAKGISLTEIPKLLSPAWSRTGFFSGNSALDMLSEVIQLKLIEDMPKVFASVAVDLSRNEVVIFKEGDVRTAIRSSISIPVLFTPVLSEGRVLVDGGLLEPVPIQLAKQLGADLVVAVDLFGIYPPEETDSNDLSGTEKALWPKGIKNSLSYIGGLSSTLAKKFFKDSELETTHIKNIIDVLESTLAISQFQLTQARMQEHPADVLIRPSVSHVGMLDFHRGQPIIKLGEEAGENAATEIKRLIAQNK